MKQPSLLVLFFLLFAMASAETPELLRLADNTSNDYRVGASGKYFERPSLIAPMIRMLPVCTWASA